MSIDVYRQHTNNWVEMLAPAAELAKSIATTDFVPKTLRNNPAAIAAAILYGHEIGLGPMQSLARIAVVDGRPTLAAETQRALILAAGHELWIEEATITRVTVGGRRRDSDQISRVTWTMDDAKRAGIAGKHNWRTYPRQMLTARASAELARAMFADAIGGLAATEELDGDTSDEPAGEEPAAKGTRRRRPPVTVSAPPDDRPALPGDEPPPPEGQPDTRMIDEPTRRFLHSKKKALGLDDEQLKNLIEQITGQRSTTQVPVAQLGELYELMETKATKTPGPEQAVSQQPGNAAAEAHIGATGADPPAPEQATFPIPPGAYTDRG